MILDPVVSRLLTEPLWRPEHLGLPIPDSPHAVSACLPTWRDNVGYEEQDPRVLQRLRAGYPRFVYNPICRELFAVCERRFARDGETCLVFPSRNAAQLCAEFVKRQSAIGARLQDLDAHGCCCVVVPSTAAAAAKAFWQHSGLGVSSRQAAAVLAGPNRTQAPAPPAHTVLRQRVAEALGVTDGDVWLFPTGMSAFFTLYRALQRAWPDRTLVQFGFPYVDSLKIPQCFGPGVHFFPRGDEQELQQLESLLETEPVCGIATEFPTNPLLTTPDLERLSAAAQRVGCPLIVDDTLATPCNVDVMPVADVVWSSLTKYFSGRGDVTGGAVVISPRSRHSDRLHAALEAEFENHFWNEDAAVLVDNSRDFAARVAAINRTGEQLADFLSGHRSVARVHYPKQVDPGHYARFQRSGGGFGGLLSIDLRDPARQAPQMFDRLRVCKGPNLGMNYTLACPFTILAHYRELDFAESCGVSRWLIRISVGLEPADELIRRFAEALDSE